GSLDGGRDPLDRLGFCVGDLEPGVRLGLGRQDLRLLLTLSLIDLRLPDAFRLQRARLLFGFGGEDRGAPVALGAHLLLHRIPDVTRRVDVLELHPAHLRAPLVGRFVQDLAQLGVDRIARGEHVVQLHFADHVPQGGLGQLLDRVRQVRDLVGRAHRVGDLGIDQRVDLDDDVVLRDHVLAGEHVHRLAQVDLLRAKMARERVARRRDDHLVPVDGPRLVDDRDDQVHSGGQRAVVFSQTLDDHRLRLLHDADALGDDRDRDQRYRGGDDQRTDVVHAQLSLSTYSVAPSTRTTLTLV